MTEIPTFRPFSLIFCIAAWMSPSASQWTVMASHPASTKASMYLTGSSIIRWASKNLSEYPLTALITGGPNVMLGTNIPSITSRWIQSAPALSVLAISSPSLEKSADRIEGDTLVIGVLMGPVDNSAFASVPTTVGSCQLLLDSRFSERSISIVSRERFQYQRDTSVSGSTPIVCMRGSGFEGFGWGRSIIIAVSQFIFGWSIRSVHGINRMRSLSCVPAWKVRVR